VVGLTERDNNECEQKIHEPIFKLVITVNERLNTWKDANLVIAEGSLDYSCTQSRSDTDRDTANHAAN